MHTIADIVLFVMKHKADKWAFKDWESKDVAILTFDAVVRDNFIYSVNEFGDINGVLLVDKQNDKLKVCNILSDGTKNVGKKLLQEVYKKWNFSEIIYVRKGCLERSIKNVELFQRHINYTT